LEINDSLSKSVHAPMVKRRPIEDTLTFAMGKKTSIMDNSAIGRSFWSDELKFEILPSKKRTYVKRSAGKWVWKACKNTSSKHCGSLVMG
jgi:hypothetical protein